MNAPHSVVMILCAVVFSAPAFAHDRAPQTRPPFPAIGVPQVAGVGQDPTPTEWRLDRARRVTPAGPGDLSEVTGAFTSDPQVEALRFETDEGTLFMIPYEDISAMHYEESRHGRGFLRRSRFRITIHFTNAFGEPAFETIRVQSREDSLTALDSLERHTGLRVERARPTASFLGIPVRARVGTRVVVTDDTGRRATGTIRQLSATSLEFLDSTGVTRAFTDESLRRMRLSYSPRHDIMVGLGVGAAAGAFVGVVTAGLGGCPTEGCSDLYLKGATVGAAVVGGLGALLGPTIGALRYPFNDAFDVYEETARSSRTRALVVAPHVSGTRKGVLVSLRF